MQRNKVLACIAKQITSVSGSRQLATRERAGIGFGKVGKTGRGVKEHARKLKRTRVLKRRIRGAVTVVSGQRV